MLKNYLKIAGRHLWKHKAYVFINLLGIGVGLAMCILAYLTWEFDQDFDRFHTNNEHIFRVTTTKTNSHQVYGVSPRALGGIAEAQIAGVQAGITLDSRGLVVTNGKDTHREEITFTEPDFFKWFSFKIVAGEVDLSNPNNLIITEKLALKYFGIDNPIGKTLTLNPAGERKNLTVTGVLKDIPVNSSIRLEGITSWRNQVNHLGEAIQLDDWRYLTNSTFLVLKNPADQQAVKESLASFIPVQNAAHEEWQVSNFQLEPLNGMAHHAADLRWNSMRRSLPPAMVPGSIAMGLLLLLTACLNFTNMTISLAGKRLKEIGLRKVLGSNRRQLIVQLLTEGFLLSLGGLLLGLLLINQFLPSYNQMWRFMELHLSFADNLPLVGFLVAVVIGTTILAAAYPAFYVSAFAPSKIFRGSVKLAGNNSLSRILLGAQVVISALTIVSGISFASNADFQQTADLGFQREGIQAIFVPNEQTYQVMEQMAKQWPEVESVAGVHAHIGDSAPRFEFQVRQEFGEAELMWAGRDYLETMEISLKQGRSFNYDLPSDYDNTILVNERFAKEFFPNEDPIDQQIILSDSIRHTIVGVVGDFMQDNFMDPSRPLILDLVKPGNFQYLVLKSKAEDLLAIRTQLDQAWKSNFPDIPFEHNFQNDFLAQSFEVSSNLKQLFGAFSLLTLFLTLAGLASLLSLSISKRLKEITIRRILGAGASHITYILSSNFLIIISLSLIIGGIIGLWFTRLLLDNIFRIHAGVSIQAVFIAAALVLLMVFITIASRLFSVVNGNPVDHLKSEN